VAENTNQKIKDILTDVDPSTCLVLVNAIYFKGDWKDKFDVKNTKEEDFHVSPTETVKVPLMFMRDADVMYGVSDTLNCQAVELPYAGDTLSMVVLLPDHTKTNLKDLESKLTADALINVESTFNMRKKEINLWLPRFKLEETLELNGVLAKMGMADMFVGGKADLSGIDGTKKLYVSEVVHKAFVEVNEEGSEAAAATMMKISLACYIPPTLFRADHPFLLFIRNKITNSIMFFGRVVKP
jgi:serpin B